MSGEGPDAGEDPRCLPGTIEAKPAAPDNPHGPSVDAPRLQDAARVGQRVQRSWTEAAARSKTTEWTGEAPEEYVAGISLKNNFDLTVGYLALRYSAEEVERAAKVWVRALDYGGKPFELECDGLLAIAVQHEHDHLEGTLFVDHLSSLKRELIRRRMKKLKAERAAARADQIRTASRHESAL